MTETTFSEYQKRTADTAIYPGAGDPDSILGLTYVALGLGETGELQGKVKKILRDDNGVLTPDKHAALVGELGDVLWYVSQMATQLGVTLDSVAADNLAKLAGRKSRGVLQGSGDNR